MLSKVIILLGPDKAGKSTLCSALRKEYPWLNYNKGLRIERLFDMMKYDEDLLKKIQADVNPWILDRFHYPDESIYCKLSRNSDLPADVKLWYDHVVVSTLQRLNALFIYCFADTNVLSARFKASGETDIKEDWLPQLRSAYDNWASSCLVFPILKLDSTTLTPQDMVLKAKQFIELH
jgi:deoxyadenosine/deoxycytidine kinase